MFGSNLQKYDGFVILQPNHETNLTDGILYEQTTNNGFNFDVKAASKISDDGKATFGLGKDYTGTMIIKWIKSGRLH